METGLLGLALGAVVGAILALTGAGGGILAVPLPAFGLHLSIMQAAPVGPSRSASPRHSARCSACAKASCATARRR